eukprot:TRINITY_DN18483_c0_g1_i2.p1 TRINITY_DN18483_c0_g1~~TRINITY_DN18483_c0_g1_i2.p1  ORF type:complete len:151 (+),score=44.66 TRINITY_DN18483_c0_g1_i2:60-512(+)
MWRRAARFVAAGAAVGGGAVAAGAMGAAHAKQAGEAEAAMRDNLARRLAKSYVHPKRVAVAKDSTMTFHPTSGKAYPVDLPVPSLVTVVDTVQEDDVVVRFPEGNLERVVDVDLCDTHVYHKLEYWRGADPAMAVDILRYVALVRKGKNV